VIALTVQAALAAALNCATGVDPQTAVSIARAESGLNPLAVHGNTIGMSYAPETPDEAIKVATPAVLPAQTSPVAKLLTLREALGCGLARAGPLTLSECVDGPADSCEPGLVLAGHGRHVD